MKREYRRIRHYNRTHMEVRIMAKAEGYVMVRRKGASPFIITENDWLAGEPVT